jgi:lipocalin
VLRVHFRAAWCIGDGLPLKALVLVVYLMAGSWYESARFPWWFNQDLTMEEQYNVASKQIANNYREVERSGERKFKRTGKQNRAGLEMFAHSRQSCEASHYDGSSEVFQG